MAARALVLLLFLLAVAVAGVLRPRDSYSAPAETVAPLPQAALRALREGRFLRASLVLRDYLGAAGDTSAAALLLSARAEAGLGDWERVQHLLRGQLWLDTLAGGHGWELLGRSQLELKQWVASEASYARYLALADTGADRAQGLAHVRHALAQTNAGAHDSAVASYRQAMRHLPQIEDWLHLFAASAAASAGDTATVELELAGADSAVREDWGWRARVRARAAAEQPRSALTIAEAVATDHGASSTRAEANLRAGELRLGLGDSAGARVAWLRTLAGAPGSAYAAEAARSLARLRQATPTDHRRAGEVLLRHGNVAAALPSLDAFLTRGAPSAADRLAVRLAAGRALFTAGRYPAAESRLLAYADSSPDAATAASALYTAARAQYRDGRRSLALGTLQRVIERFPRETSAAQAAYLIADLAHDAGELERARRYYREATVLAPVSEPAGLARMRLAGMAYERANYTAALELYQAYLAAFPNGQRAQQARYWAALAHQQLGRTTDSNRLLRQVRAGDPFSYYGVRAADRLESSFWDVTLEPSPDVNITHEGQVARALARLELLREIGWDDAAGFELGRARRHFANWDGAVYSLAEGLIQRGYPSTAISMGWDLFRREGAWNLRLLRVVYPFPFQQIILNEAAERGVDPFLAAGLIRQESMFNQRAVSPAGAIGLMQVMPATGRTLARALGIRNFNPEMLKQPDVNVLLGMTYLSDQLKTWNGRPVPVLAAYNAGPSRVERWRAFPEWGRDELFAERIPYEETRDYVKIVQRNAAVYRALYGAVISEQQGD